LLRRSGRSDGAVEGFVGRVEVKLDQFAREGEAFAVVVEPVFLGIGRKGVLDAEVDTEEIVDRIFVFRAIEAALVAVPISVLEIVLDSHDSKEATGHGRQGIPPRDAFVHVADLETVELPLGKQAGKPRRVEGSRDVQRRSPSPTSE